jgi:hypothetical protein
MIAIDWERSVEDTASRLTKPEGTRERQAICHDDGATSGMSGEEQSVRTRRISLWASSPGDPFCRNRPSGWFAEVDSSMKCSNRKGDAMEILIRNEGQLLVGVLRR